MLTRLLGLLLVMTVLLSAEQSLPHRRRIWKWSVAALAAANAGDAMSSMGRYELNPVLGRGPFGWRATGIKISIPAATIGVEYLILRRHPEAIRKAASLNFGMAGVTTGVSVHNLTH